MIRRNYFSLATLLLVLLSFNWIAEQPVRRLTVLSYNALFLNLKAEPTLEVLRASAADIVGLQEVNGVLLEQLGKQLGYSFFQFPSHAANLGAQDVGILSRYPIAETLTYGVVLRLPGNQKVGVFNLHLAPFPYEPHLVRDGHLTLAEEVVASAAQRRLPQIQAVAQEMDSLFRRGVPVFLLGDFNEPSHLDWTGRAAEAGLHFGMEVPFPVSSFLESKGFQDAYRSVWPDELSHPGHTWAAHAPKKEEPDRIDFIYFKGMGLEVQEAGLIGETQGAADVVVPGFPSDHRAVYAHFDWNPHAQAWALR